MDPTIRLRIATRIHFALLRHYGEHVDVAGLLRGQADAREVLWVCEASGHAELANLAKQFDAAAMDLRRLREALSTYSAEMPQEVLEALQAQGLFQPST